jgi:hypothetical protein
MENANGSEHFVFFAYAEHAYFRFKKGLINPFIRFVGTPDSWNSRTRHGKHRKGGLVRPVRSENRPKQQSDSWHVSALNDYCSSNITCTEAAAKYGKSPQAFNYWLKKKEITPTRRDDLRHAVKCIDMDSLGSGCELHAIGTG